MRSCNKILACVPTSVRVAVLSSVVDPLGNAQVQGDNQDKSTQHDPSQYPRKAPTSRMLWLLVVGCWLLAVGCWSVVRLVGW